MLVKLQRPPPDMRIFLPALLERSMSSTWRPRAAAVRAHIRPAAPAPMITTSVERTTHPQAQVNFGQRERAPALRRGFPYATIWDPNECSMSRSADRLRSSGDG